MTLPIEIVNRDHTAADLRGFAARSADARQVRRLLAIALILDGFSRAEAAERCGMQRQTLRDWVHRYNEKGVAGLTTGHGPGRPPALTADQMAEFRDIAVNGPDPEKDGIVRWRCADLRSEAARRFDVDVHERTIGKWLRGQGLTRLQPRPFHPKKDAAAQESFKKTSPNW